MLRHLMVLFFFLNAFSMTAAAFERGEKVVLDHGPRRIYEVQHSTRSGLVQLDNDRWYPRGRIIGLIPEIRERGLKVLQSVYLDYGGPRRLATIQAIAKDGLVQLDSGVWYHHDFIKGRLTTYRGISQKDLVLERFRTQRIQKVVDISDDALFLLEDGRWYPFDHLDPLQ